MMSSLPQCELRHFVMMIWAVASSVEHAMYDLGYATYYYTQKSMKVDGTSNKENGNVKQPTFKLLLF